MPPESGDIGGRWTQDLPLGYLQGGKVPLGRGRTCAPSIETSGSLLSDPAPFFGFVCGPVGSKNGFVCRPVGDPIFGFACGAVGEDGLGEFPVIAASRSS